jgi:LysM repeat protein
MHEPDRGQQAQQPPAYHDQPLVCTGPDLLYNGSFEQGFADTPLGEVGRGWGAFTNGGAANFGFYDEQWEPVVADGDHGQLIEINSKGVFPTDPDRYAGIYQRVEGLHPGATYEFSLRGLLRGEGNEEDPYRFSAQWGVGTNPDWSKVDDDDWKEMNLGPIYKRTEPGGMATYTARFEAPASHIVIFIRGWKKWGITNVEMDFNLDAIRLNGCQPAKMGGTGGPDHDGGMDQDGSNCVYVVKPGDSLGAIAERFGVSMDAIMRANGIDNADLIYVGQKFEIPGCGQSGPPSGQMPMNPPGEAGGPPQGEEQMRPEPQSGPERPGADERGGSHSGRSYTVQDGDMLGAIAATYGLDAYALASFNGIDNMNLIVVGQVLRIPDNAN